MGIIFWLGLKESAIALLTLCISVLNAIIVLLEQQKPMDLSYATFLPESWNQESVGENELHFFNPNCHGISVSLYLNTNLKAFEVYFDGVQQNYLVGTNPLVAIAKIESLLQSGNGGILSNKVHQARRDRCAIWCGYNGWTELYFLRGYPFAKPPEEDGFKLVPSAAYKPLYPGRVTDGV